MFIDNNEAIRKIEKEANISFSKEQDAIFRHHGGMCILACAGAGKTSTLTYLLVKRLLTGEIKDTSKLLCTTYSKSGAKTMEGRISKVLKRMGINDRITVKTLHAFYLMILKHFGFTANVIDGKTRLKFIAESCRDARISLGDDDLQLIDSLLSYQVNNLMSDAMLVKSYVYTLDNVSEQQFTAIRTGYNNRKQMNQLIDFDDMQLYMYSLLVQQKREDILAYCKHNWTDFYIDEAQDISKIQFEILRKLITDPNKIVFIGDDDQCIYQWRGADPSIILNICGYYDIEKFLLSTNYRCYSNIVNPAAVGIKNNCRRSDKTMKPFNEGGRLRIVDTHGGNLCSQAKYAAVHIKKLIDEDGVSPDDIAVLSRNNQHLAILSNILMKLGIYCDTSPEMRMTTSSIYKDIKNVIEVSSNTYNRGIVASTLWRLCLYMNTRTSKVMADFMDVAGLSLRDALGFVLKNILKRDNVEWNGKVKVPIQAQAKMEQYCHCLRDDTIEYMKYTYELLNEADELKCIVGFLGLYLEATKFMYKTEDRVRLAEGMVEYVIELTKTLGLDGLKSYLRTSEQIESGIVAIPGAKVCMSTMHGSKGREWEHVVLFADDNVTFPSFEGVASMGANGVSVADISASIDENRRLHYVAMTRAKSDLTIFTDSNNTSVYTLEALGVYTPPLGASNATIIDMANNGKLYDDLVERSKKMLFSKDSPYYYDLGLDKKDKEEVNGTIKER